MGSLLLMNTESFLRITCSTLTRVISLLTISISLSPTPQTAELSEVIRIACLRHAEVLPKYCTLTSSSVCYRHTILLSPHEAQRRVGFKSGEERKKKSAPKARFLVFGGDYSNFFFSVSIISTVILSRSYFGFQPHSLRAQLSSILFGHESAIAWRIGSNLYSISKLG